MVDKRALIYPRKARVNSGAKDGWWYINKNGIEILAQPTGSNPTCVMLTKKQLQRALELMEIA